MRREEMKYYILAVIGIATSILFFIGLLTFMTIADDLSKKVDRQEKYIKELQLELKSTELICLGYTNGNNWIFNDNNNNRIIASDIKDNGG